MLEVRGVSPAVEFGFPAHLDLTDSLRPATGCSLTRFEPGLSHDPAGRLRYVRSNTAMAVWPLV